MWPKNQPQLTMKSVKPVTNSMNDNHQRITQVQVNTTLTHNAWTLPLEISSHKLLCLLDTGASHSLLSKKSFDKIAETLDLTLRPAHHKISVADGSALATFGITSLPLTLGSCHFHSNVIVANLPEIDFLFGHDLLSHFNASISYGSGKLTLTEPLTGQHYALKLQQSTSEKTCRIYINKDIQVMPLSETLVYTSTHSDIFSGRTCIFEPNTTFPNKTGLAASRAVVLPTTSKSIPVSVINAHDTEYVLRKGTFLGHIAHISVNNITTLPSSDTSNPTTSHKRIPEELTTLIQQCDKTLSKSQTLELKQLLTKYSDRFHIPGTKLGKTDIIKHEIDTGNTHPIKIPPRREPPHKHEIIEQEVEKLLHQNLISHSVSPWSAPVVMATKHDGSPRLCIDYRKINSMTVKDSFPLPCVQQAVNSFHGAQYFCSLDLCSGFYQIAMDEKSRQKTAFATQSGLYEFNVLPFGLTNAPATFVRLMEAVLRGLNWKRCLVYIDDILIFGKTFHETLHNLELVLDRLRSANLVLKPSKCHMFKESIPFLGHVISRDGVTCDPNKISAVKSWPTPTNPKELTSFLGLTGYYRRFIFNYAKIISPLQALTHKKSKWIWTHECQTAFNSLKDKMISKPILSFPSTTDEFILDCDASNSAIGAVLSQIQNGKEKVIAYHSYSLSNSERSYCTTKRELLAVVHSIRKLRYYLSSQPFTVRTDHAALQWLLNFKDTDGILARWLTTLSKYSFTLVHRAGKNHSNADALSRRPPVRKCPRVDCDHCRPATTPKETTIGQVMLTNETTSTSSTHAQDIPSWLDGFSLKELAQAQKRDPVLKNIINLINSKSPRPHPSRLRREGSEFKTYVRIWDELRIVNDVLYRRCYQPPLATPRFQLVVPMEIRTNILQACHDSLLAGHRGHTKTWAKIKTNFYWPNYQLDVKIWVRKCIPCAKKKGRPTRSNKLLRDPSGEPLDRLGIDIMGPLPTTQNDNKYIMVVIDHFTKYSEAYALKSHTAIDVSDVLVTQFISRFGIPKQLISDQGPEFMSDVFKHLCTMLSIEKLNTSPYSPTTNGATERQNHIIQQMLAIYITNRPLDWDQHLPLVNAAYNSTVSSSTGFSPNQLLFGRELNSLIDIQMPAKPEEVPKPSCPLLYTQWLQSSLQTCQQAARENIDRAYARQNRNADEKLKPHILHFTKGQFVWYFYKPLDSKLELPWTGPYLITRMLSPHTAEIQRSADSPKQIVNTDKLKHYTGPEIDNWLSNEIGIQVDMQLDQGEPQPDSIIEQPTVSQDILPVITNADNSLPASSFMPEVAADDNSENGNNPTTKLKWGGLPFKPSSTSEHAQTAPPRSTRQRIPQPNPKYFNPDVLINQTSDELT